jgi:hypothetical protein
VAPGAHCTSPHACPFLAHCTRGVALPEWPLASLPALDARRREALEAMGIADVRAIPDGFRLNALQRTARDAMLRGHDVVHGDLAGALGTLRDPVHHLDFETAGPALPCWPGTRAYDAVPFQYSVHTRHADGTLAHAQYLHPDASDPREPLATALLDALGGAGSIVVYSGFERRVIAALAAALPHRAPALRALLPRLWDLHPVVRGTYYHPGFHGSFSMKSVLPALCPELSYRDLDIADGNAAAASWLRAVASDDPDERQRLFAALRAYCARDTLGLVRVLEALAARARTGPPAGAAARGE